MNNEKQHGVLFNTHSLCLLDFLRLNLYNFVNYFSMKHNKILVVDDIFINRALLVELAEEINIACIQARDGRQAIDCIESNDDIDLVLMDIEMPVMNGFETTKYIRDKLSFPKNNIPVVAITAHDPETFEEEFRESGFDDLITKPYTLEKLSDLFKNLNKTG